jgi:hypothetical protein
LAGTTSESCRLGRTGTGFSCIPILGGLFGCKSRILARLKSLTYSCGLATNLGSTEADLFLLSTERTNQIRGYGLTVALNGHNSKLQLDTGASGIVIDRTIAQRAGLTKLSDTTLGGFGDQRKSTGYFAIANSIKVGELEFRNCPVRLVDKRSVLGEDGLIGTDVLQEFLIDLDSPNKRLRLGKLPKRPGEDSDRVVLRTDAREADSPEGESKTDTVSIATDVPVLTYTNLTKRFVPAEFSFTFTPVFRVGHILLVPTQVGDTPESRLFMLDTGASKNMFSVNVAREITKVHANPRMAVKGLSGSVNRCERRR